MPMAMAAVPLNRIERAHQMYRDGLYAEALRFYTEALSMAKTNSQRIALHSNRAACHLKLHDFNKAAEECTWVLELDHNHTGALMLRAQTLVTLKEYHSALFDVNRLIELNPSSEVYQNLHTRLKTQLSLAPIPESEAELEEEEEEEYVIEYNTYVSNEKCIEEKENVVAPSIDQVQKPELNYKLTKNTAIPTTQGDGGLSKEGGNQKPEVKMTAKSEVVAPQAHIKKGTIALDPKGWQTIPKPKVQKPELNFKLTKNTIIPTTQGDRGLSIEGGNQKPEVKMTAKSEVVVPQIQIKKGTTALDSKGWQTIPKPKGHSTLDYARWDSVEDDSSEEDDDDEESGPQFRFRVRTVGVKSVK